MITRIARLLGRAVPPALAALALILGAAAPASAHAELLSTDPVDGSALEIAPDTATLTFSEAVQPVAEAMLLVDAAGTERPLNATAADTAVSIELPELDDGSYYLSWRVISADSHPIAGVVSFSVGTGAAPAPPPDAAESDQTGPPPALQAANALHYAGVLLFGGWICFRVAIARDLAPPRPRHRLLRVSGAVAILGAALAVPLGALDLAGQPLSEILDTSAWSASVQPGAVAIVAATAVGLPLAYAALAAGRSRWSRYASLAIAAAVVAAPLLIGHSMAFGPRWLTVGSDAIHLAAAAIWTGGLAGLILVLARLRRGHTTAEAAAAVVARFSSWAGITVAALGITGLLMAWRIHRSWASVFESDHGRVLLLKLALVAVALAFASWNRFRLLPSIRTADAATGLRRLQRIVRAEAATLGVVIAITGILVNLPPGADEAAEAPTAPALEDGEPVEMHADLGGGAAQLAITPGTTGEYSFTLTLTDADGSPLEPFEAPTVTATLAEKDFGPLQAELHDTSPGSYHGVVDLPLPGEWQLAVQIRLNEFDAQTVLYDLTVR